MAETAISERTAVVHRGRKLEYFTIGWNSLEGLVTVAGGFQVCTVPAHPIRCFGSVDILPMRFCIHTEIV